MSGETGLAAWDRGDLVRHISARRLAAKEARARGDDVEAVNHEHTLEQLEEELRRRPPLPPIVGSVSMDAPPTDFGTR